MSWSIIFKLRHTVWSWGWNKLRHKAPHFFLICVHSCTCAAPFRQLARIRYWRVGLQQCSASIIYFRLCFKLDFNCTTFKSCLNRNRGKSINKLVSVNTRHSILPQKGEQLVCPPWWADKHTTIESFHPLNEWRLYPFSLRTKARCKCYFCPVWRECNCLSWVPQIEKTKLLEF